MKTKQVVRIVLCSPGDVPDERRVMETVIEELNTGIADERDLRLELSRWETDAYPGFHPEGPQGLIDPILNIEDCDVLLGIFWKRFGTPTMGALSGTEHEIRTAIQSYQVRRRPQIMIYFKESPYVPKTKEECDQQKLVIQFREDFPKEGLYWTFKDAPEFEKQARRHLTQYIRSPSGLAAVGSEPSPQRPTSKPLFVSTVKRCRLDSRPFISSADGVRL